MALDHVNVFALRDGAGWALVDTGFDSRRSRAIWAEILAAPLGGDPITKVIATHHHPDHIGLAGWFMGQGAELITTRTAWLMARMLILDEQARPTEETLDFWRAAGMAPDILAKRAAERPFNFADMVHPLPLGYTRIAEGDVIQIGGRHWHIRIGHGHAPEHATLWSVEDNLVLGGDQLLPSISPNLGVYATEPAADPVHDWLESCEAFQPFAAEDHFVLPGHKLPYTGLPDRLRQLIDNHHGALDRLREHLGTPRTAAECFAPLFKRKIEEGTYGLALVESLAHLNHLLALGEVTREKRADGAWVWQREN
ncbi:MBL fold metallo-hydrolase [Roseobacter sp. HKCCD9010]|nr:MBL fold metallo-hydrolase [Rhodobacterales bacterium HKCCD4356]NNV10713.1 MBL fold metallo-hydrolase [Roseobacter sp. HKCCD7357]NNV14898.1 MBL fold metallo-hydrolase [Roseobacter sp. HKCCD8768]NNV24357.1 MBL fold metallo-hydrolase [Roseobacter sp. HKCCD8192]NNV28614.1 MBL fold metallo-hydrolase [Roseobacter sp. HKCCD9061]NNV32887.1 MBL fold metallo-hydrolase [Roseobacter sp. HKCCD9073]NNV37138.1 MBL fold metallo-hydrolase [Roseobacter sp. HKCCD9054]NNV41095.1 MBL fold metallo-hydrolase [